MSGQVKARISCWAIITSVMMQSVDAICKILNLQNAVYQMNRNGEYHLLPESEWCTSNRPSYRQSGRSDNYLYYLDTGEEQGWRGWMVGSTRCQNLGGIASAGVAMTPDEIAQGSWEEVYNGEWHYSHSLAAVCQGPLGTGAIIAVAVAAVIVLGIFSGVFVCCVVKNKAKLNNSVQVSPRSHQPRPRRRSQVTTVSASIESRRSESTTCSSTFGPGHSIPSDFVYVAAPPPYEEEYKFVPPPSYSVAVEAGTSDPQTAGESVPSEPGQTSPPPYTSPEPSVLIQNTTLPLTTDGNNAHSNPAYDGEERTT